MASNSKMMKTGMNKVRTNQGIALTLLALATTALCPAQAQSPWPAEQFNPAAAAGDVIIPMPCGGSMAFRRVAVPSANALDDRRVQLGGVDQRFAYLENARLDYIGAGLSDKDKRNQAYFLIGKYEVTQGQFETLSGTCPKLTPESRLPRTGISWTEAVHFTGQYTTWLARNAAGKIPSEDGQPAFVRLPTEAEWEYAARGGMSVAAAQFEQPVFEMPEGIMRYIWHAGTDSSNNELNVIGLLKPNPLGLHDILGNAGEFVMDPFRINKHSRLHGQAGGYTIKGGDYRTPAGDIRSSARVEYVPIDASGERRDKATGFRLVFVAPSITSSARLQSVRSQWSSLAQAGVSQQALADPIKEIELLAKETADPALKRRIEGVGSTMKANIQARNEQRARAARSEVRVAAYLAKKILEDRAKVRALQAIVSGPMPDDLKKGPRDNLRMSQEAVEGTLDYLVETVRQIGRDYPGAAIAEQAEMLKREFEARKAPSDYLPLIDSVASASRAVAAGKPIDRTALVAELAKVEKSR